MEAAASRAKEFLELETRLAAAEAAAESAAAVQRERAEEFLELETRLAAANAAAESSAAVQRERAEKFLELETRLVAANAAAESAAAVQRERAEQFLELETRLAAAEAVAESTAVVQRERVAVAAASRAELEGRLRQALAELQSEKVERGALEARHQLLNTLCSALQCQLVQASPFSRSSRPLVCALFTSDVYASACAAASSLHTD